MEKFDLIVVGGGPGGYVAALRASQLHMKVALVERENLGGICLNWGCIPTKALLRTSEIYHQTQNLGAFGLSAEKISFDLEKVVARSRTVSGQLSRGVQTLLKKANVKVFEQDATLSSHSSDGHVVSLGSQKGEAVQITAPNVILATGARARHLPGLEPDGALVWTYREALVPKTVPNRLLVVGSGAIGVEFASFYHQMGAQVTIAEVADRILIAEDPEISALARKSFEKQGIKILTKAKLGTITKRESAISVAISTEAGQSDFTFDCIISAVGIVGNVENLGLERTKAKLDRTHIVVDAYGATDEPGLWAIGDVAGAPWLAHKAMHEGVICAEKIAGLSPDPLHALEIPGCTYSRPQIASVGMTEEKALASGREIKVGRFPFIGNGKALAMGESEGLTKTVFDAQTGELLGAHMIGPEVTELIQGYVIARSGELTDAELKKTVFPHPTISGTMHESVLAAWGAALHF